MLKNPFLTDEEEEQIVFAWNNTRQDFPATSAIHQLFEAQVDLTPHAPAVTCEQARLTYQQLNLRANQLAHYLRSLGVSSERAVAIYMEHTVDILVAILGILKAGGFYVPLDTQWPAERLRMILADAAVACVVTRSLPADSSALSPVRVVSLEEEAGVIAAMPQTNLPILTVAANLALMLYTSGSTGAPKGVLTTHGNLISEYFAWEVAYQLRKRITSHCQIANIAFAVFQADWIRALCSGGKLVLCPRDVVLTPRRLYRTMLEEAVDFVEFVPGVLRNYLAYLNEAGLSLSFLHTLVVGSDRWYVQEHRNLASFCASSTQIIHSFGLTETTIDSAYFLQTAEDLPAGQLVPIGRPFPNVQLYILDAWLRPVPIGVPGNLFIGGKGLAAGYLHHPDLTAEHFIPHPFATEPGQRCYRAGDLACYLPDGNIQFLGRKDHQVKIHGFRVDIGEIEVALRQHPAISQAAVVARISQTGEQQLLAYVVPKRVPAEQTFPRYRLTSDLEVAYLHKMETHHLYQKIFLYNAYTRHLLPLHEGACVIDVGANIGLFTLFAHQQASNINLYAIEPCPSVFNVLQANIRLHSIKAQAICCALADREAQATCTLYSQASELSSLSPDDTQDYELLRQLTLARLQQHLPALTALPPQAESLIHQRRGKQVDGCSVKTVSTIIQTYHLTHIDLVKISALRSELQILHGITSDDWPKIRQLVLEVYDDQHSLNKVTDYLAERSYALRIEQIPGFEKTALFYISAISTRYRNDVSDATISGGQA